MTTTGHDHETIPLASEMIATLRALRARTGVGASALLKHAADCPDGLTAAMLASWLYPHGRTKTVRRDHYRFACALWQSLPDDPHPRIPLTEEMHRTLSFHRDRTGIRPKALLTHASDVPEGLTRGLIQRWLHAKRPVKTVRADYYEFVVDLWAGLPDAPVAKDSGDPTITLTDVMVRQLQQERERTGVSPARLLVGATGRPSGLTASVIAGWLKPGPEGIAVHAGHFDYVVHLWRSLRDDPDPRIPLTEPMRQRLRRERERSGVPAAQLSAIEPGFPIGLSAGMVRAWLHPKPATKTVRRSHYDFVLRLWQSLPDDPEGFIPLTETMRLRLRAERDRTGVNPNTLLTATPVDGLSPGSLARWLQEKKSPKRVRRRHFREVLTRWRALPDGQYQALTETLKQQLLAEKERTGVSVRSLLARQSSCPSGLTEKVINHWLSGKRTAKRARRDHIRFVLSAWQDLPDDPIVTLTRDTRQELKAQQERSGLGSRALLYGRTDKPEGLTVSKIQNWLNGSVKRVRQRHLAYVRACWAAAPNAQYPREERVSLTPAITEELCRLREESGIGPSALLRGAEDRPQGLAGDTIRRWLTGKAKTANPVYLDYVRRRWADPPSRSMAGKKRLSKRLPRTPLNDARIARLNAEYQRTGVGVTALFRIAKDVPQGLNIPMVARWLRGECLQVRTDHYAYVLNLWASLPDARTNHPHPKT
ncbi:MAG: hypothetical protein AAFY02_00815 [Pseudomonadota bacterium]